MTDLDCHQEEEEEHGEIPTSGAQVQCLLETEAGIGELRTPQPTAPTLTE